MNITDLVCYGIPDKQTRKSSSVFPLWLWKCENIYAYVKAVCDEWWSVKLCAHTRCKKIKTSLLEKYWRHCWRLSCVYMCECLFHFNAFSYLRCLVAVFLQQIQIYKHNNVIAAAYMLSNLLLHQMQDCKTWRRAVQFIKIEFRFQFWLPRFLIMKMR